MALYPPTFQSRIGYGAFIPFYRKRGTLPYLITKKKSFDFISADTMQRGQLSHIKEVSDVKPFFDQFWDNGKELLSCWQDIKRAKEEKEKRIMESARKRQTN